MDNFTRKNPPNYFENQQRLRGGDLDDEIKESVIRDNAMVAAINNIEAQIIIGSDKIENAKKVAVSNGVGTEFKLIDSANIADEGIDFRSIKNETLTNEKYAPQSVSGNKIAMHTIELKHLKKNDSCGAFVTGVDGSAEVVMGEDNLLPLVCREDNSPAFQKLQTPAYGAASITGPCLADGVITTSKIADGAITAEKIAQALADLLCPIGATVGYAGDAAPAGWLMCDGAAVSRVTYARLFAVIGAKYGAGDGVTTFNAPDYRGRAPVGLCDANAGGRITTATFDRIGLGGVGGSERHTLTTEEMPSHNHPLGQHGVASMVSNGSLVSGGGAYYRNTAVMATDEKGGGQPHNNVQPSIFTNFIIKY